MVLVQKKPLVLITSATNKLSKAAGKASSLCGMMLNSVDRQYNVLTVLDKCKYVNIYPDNDCNCLFTTAMTYNFYTVMADVDISIWLVYVTKHT